MTERCRIIVGDSRTALAELPERSVRCCVTSPPYWGLRDYGVAGQIGLEATQEAWVADLVSVFREVRRVLTDDGTLWVNCGDAYAANARGNKPGQFDSSTLTNPYRHDEVAPPMDKARMLRHNGKHARLCDDGASPKREAIRPRARDEIKPKDLLGLPWMLAFALRADGWYLRSDIIWHKPNPMPESVTDRPTKSHEYIFLFSKSPRYFFDAGAIAEALTTEPNAQSRGPKDTPNRGPREGGNTGLHDMAMRIRDGDVSTRNTRSVWTIPTQGYSGAHFATFPRELAARCIKAGSAVGDLVLDPFLGTGTTIGEALMLGRRGVGVELNPEYAKLAEKRIAETCPLLAGATP